MLSKSVIQTLIIFSFVLLTFLQIKTAEAAVKNSDLNQNGTDDALETEVMVASSTTLSAGTYHFERLMVPSGITLTLASDPVSGDDFKGVLISASVVDVEGAISADGTGYSQANPGPGTSSESRAGAAHGGTGSHGTPWYGSAIYPRTLGSAGKFKEGGGAIEIQADQVNINGILSANGTPSASGGSILIRANVISGAGSIKADGGKFYNSSVINAPGAGGRIAIHSGQNNFTGEVSARGGVYAASGGVPTSYAHNGTIAFIDSVTNTLTSGHNWRVQNNDSSYQYSSLVIPSGWVEVEEGAGIYTDTVEVTDGQLNFGYAGRLNTHNFTIAGTGKVVLNHTEVNRLDTLIVKDSASMSAAPLSPISIEANYLSVATSASIRADNTGYNKDDGGPGTPLESDSRTGASHGGLGSGSNPAPTYGDELEPNDFGSSSQIGGTRGGGIVKIAANSAIIDGQISAKGGSAASGGSVLIEANQLSGVGKIEANGGNFGRTAVYYGAGGGGRVAIYYRDATNWSGTAEAKGGRNVSSAGSPTTYAQDGSVVFKENVPQCCSSVLFLPGIMGSELYEGEDKRWEPGGEDDIERLYLDADGKSVNQIVAGAVIDTFDGPAILNFDLYESFLADLEERKQGGFLDDYVAYGYDWRLSLPDILASGALQNEVRELALGSKSKKVTIVAHSNGGLLAKALMNALGPEASGLIDQVILVGVPQIGTPQAIGALLHGYNSGILTRYPDERARDFAKNAPFAYHLLPQSDYFDNAGFSVSTPLVRFADGEATNSFVEAYGTDVSGADELQKFLRGDEGRSAPGYADLANPIIANSSLLQDSLDVLSSIGSTWQPPAGVKVHQIAGTGELTVAGIEYWTDSKCVWDNFFSLPTHCDRRVDKLAYTPVLVYDGDHTVIEPSALAMSTSSESVSRWWVDLFTYNDSIIRNNISVLRTNHKDLLEINDVRNLILNNLIGTSTVVDFQYVFDVKPEINKPKRLSFTLHSPLSLSYTESGGQVVDADNPTGRHSEYNRYGEVQIVVVYDDESGILKLNGEEAGSFTLEIAQVDGGQVQATTTLSAIPSGTTTIATMVVNDGTISAAGPLNLDYDGNGSTDLSVEPVVGEKVTLPDEPVAEPTVAELVSQFTTYIDTNLTNKSVRKLLQKQIDAFYTIYQQKEKSAGYVRLLAPLLPYDSALRLQLKALEKQITVYVKLKRITSENALELRRLLSLLESQL